MKKKTYVLTAIASYFIFLIATIPAKPLTELLKENTPVTIKGVSGTLWNGKAYSINIDTIQLKQTDWSFNLLNLFLATVSLNINTHLLGETINAEVGASFFGRLFINDLTAKISAQEITRLAKIPLAELEGTILLNIQQASWQQGEIPLATGEIKWRDATVTVAESASLGDIVILLTETDNQLHATVQNQGGDININGTANLIPQSDYTVDIKLRPTSTASNNLKQSLGFFSQKQANGEFLLKKSGSLKDLM